MKQNRAIFYALIAIFLWSTLAALGTLMHRIPPFFLVAVTLAIGTLPALRHRRLWFANKSALLVGTFGIFGYHFLLFMSFRKAPPLEANLINYLWPIFIVILSPLLLKGFAMHLYHLVGGIIAFCGAALVISGGTFTLRAEFVDGYIMALGAAFIWALYSVLTKKLPHFPSASVAGFCICSSVLSLLCHLTLESTPQVDGREWIVMLILGFGPMGLAFYAWDAALKLGDPRTIGAISYLTPLLSTALLTATGHAKEWSWITASALILIVSGALISAGKLRWRR